MDGCRFDDEELLTSRLSLRRPTPADVDVIYRIHRDPTACAHNPSDRLATRADAEDLYRRWDEHWKRHGFGYWIIRTRAGDHRGPAQGFCGLKLVQFHNRDVLKLFYRLDPPAWGAGVATEAATAVVAWASAHVPDHPIIARVRPDNLASARVSARAGLNRAGHLDTRGEDGLDWIFVKWPDEQKPAPPSLRRATVADAAGVAQVWLRSFGTALPTVRQVHTPEQVHAWVRDVLIPGRETWVAITEHTPVAMMVLDDGWLDQLYLDPAWRGRGLGDRLVELAKRRRPDGLQLWTFQVNGPACRFYQRHGFVPVEWTDGAGNEEHEPDVRYQWRPVTLDDPK